MMYCVGLTGNVASGKSTVAKMFAQLNIDVINADDISRELTTNNLDVYHQIETHFGPDVVLEPGKLNRKYLRTIIFSNPSEKKWLEDLLHPLIRKSIEQQITNCQSAYCVIEIPLLIDKQLYPYLNKILLVAARTDLQIARVINRDNCSQKDALAILAAQVSFDVHSEGADDVLHNDSDLKELLHKVEVLHSTYLTEAKKFYSNS